MNIIILGTENSIRSCQLLGDNGEMDLKNSEIRFLAESETVRPEQRCEKNK